MKKINKTVPPKFWEEYTHSHKNVTYKDLSNNGKDSHKTDSQKETDKKLLDDLNEFLVKEQQYICAYCCRSITCDSSHNEHIRPQAYYENQSMDYLNIVASCTTNTCGMKKGSTYDETRFVSPLDDDCEQQFKFLPNGEIEGKTEKANETIDLLNLNDYALVKAREALYLECEESAKHVPNCKKFIESFYINPQDNRLHHFCDMIGYFYHSGYYDDDDILLRLSQ